MAGSTVSDAVRTLAAELTAAARRTNQRRVLVLSGARSRGVDAMFDAVDGAAVDDEDVTLVTTDEGVRFECLPPTGTRSLLGTTRELVVFDAHEGFSPNRLGQLSGVVDGGGLLVLLTPALDEWPQSRTDFDDRLAVPPFSAADVTGRFRGRLVDVLRTHPGVAIVDVDTGVVSRTGETDDATVESLSHRFASGDRTPRDRRGDPASDGFPEAAYTACLTPDQRHTVRALERLREPNTAVVVEADRGRGKSSAAGLAAASLALEGRDVLLTATGYENAREGVVRALALFETLGVDVDHDESAHVITVGQGGDGGRIRFLPPVDASTDDTADVVLVDEAAALPVRLLTTLLDHDRVAFFTTVHGYEGAGRGFTVRFRDHLTESPHTVVDVRLDEPIRYAAGDPLESLAFRALLLDARPPVSQLVTESTPQSVTYETLTPDHLVENEHRLREAFGLLVQAHYRTEPNDLARLLDAPNLTLRALCHDGHVVSVALLAREGDLDATVRRRMYDGERVRGNMLPDVFTSQLRDEAAADPVGYRVMRIATHHAVRSRGLGSALLDDIRAELAEGDPLSPSGSTGQRVDWFGVGYGATPSLVRFWRENGFRTCYLSTSRNETSGEHSVVMVEGLSPAGQALGERHGQWFRETIAGVLSDPLRDLDPDVVRAALRAVSTPTSLSLSKRAWRVVVDASFGPGLYSVAPDAFKQVALRALTADESEREALTEAIRLRPRQERLLVRKVLQCQPWSTVTDELDFVSPSQCMKALGRAYQPLVERYGDDEAQRHRRRFESREEGD